MRLFVKLCKALISTFTVGKLRLIYQITFMIALALFFSCSRNVSEDITPKGAERLSKPKARRVTWAYLRAMAANGQNPTIYKLLKDHNKLNPSGARVSGDCDPWFDKCEEDQFDDPIQQSWRVDLPFQVNGQTLWVSVVVTYNVSTGQAVSYGVAIYGNNSPNWNNYAPTTTYYANNQSTVIGNIYYSYQTQTTYQANAGLTGTGTIGPVGIEANVNGGASQTYTITQSGTIYVNTSLNLLSGWGTGTIQINGPNGPTFNYAIEPN